MVSRVVGVEGLKGLDATAVNVGCPVGVAGLDDEVWVRPPDDDGLRVTTAVDELKPADDVACLEAKVLLTEESGKSAN